MRACWSSSLALTVAIASGGCLGGGLDPNTGPDRNTHKK